MPRGAGSAAGCAARGAAWLDQVMPAWFEPLDTGSLDMSSACDCVLGQLVAPIPERGNNDGYGGSNEAGEVIVAAGRWSDGYVVVLNALFPGAVSPYMVGDSVVGQYVNGTEIGVAATEWATIHGFYSPSYVGYADLAEAWGDEIWDRRH